MKQGLALQTTVMIVIITVSFIILLPIIAQLLVYGMNYAQGGSCQATAAMASFRYDSKASACVDIVESPVSMRCDRRHIIVGPNQALVVTQGKEKVLPVYSSSQDRAFQSYDDLGATVAHSILAEEMRLCWKQFGEGSAPILDTADVNRLKGAVVNHQTACFICSDITFTESTQFTRASFNDYLRKSTTPSNKETYVEFFNSDKTLCEPEYQGGIGCWLNLERYFTTDSKDHTIFEGPRIDATEDVLTADSYAVVYVRKRFDLCQNTEQESTASEMSNWVYALPTANIPKLCDDVVT